MGLSCSNITKSYGNSTILNGFSITIEPGELHVLTGPSGSGKTTLLRILSLLEPPDTGAIFLDNVEYRYNPITAATGWKQNEQYRTRVTMVFQQLFMWPHIPMGRSIELSSNGVDVTKYAEILQVKNLLNRYPNQVSLGQRQRIALLRALTTNADYYFLDEITSALDSKMSDAVLDIVSELCSINKGVVMITHMPERLGTPNFKSIELLGERHDEHKK